MERGREKNVSLHNITSVRLTAQSQDPVFFFLCSAPLALSAAALYHANESRYHTVMIDRSRKIEHQEIERESDSLNENLTKR